MKVLIDGRMLLGRFSGVARVVTALVEHLVRRDDLRVAVLCGDEPYAPWRSRTNIEMVVTDFSRAHRRPLRRLMWESTRLSRWIERSGADVFHATWNSGVPRNCPIPAVLTIHDLIVPLHEERNSILAVTAASARRLAIARSTAHAYAVTTVSAYSRVQVLRTLRISPEKVRIVHNGVALPSGEQFGVVSGKKVLDADHPGGTKRPHLLYVGGYEERKNIAGMLAAVERYWTKYGPDVELWLTGDSGRLTAHAAEALARARNKGHIRFLGDVSDVDLWSLYSGASALLFLSLDEGFGLPALEAMGCGCPVIASNCASLPEVVGTAGELVDPRAPAQVAASIHRILNDLFLRAELSRRGRERASQFTWSDATNGYVGLYAAAAAGFRGPAGRVRAHRALKNLAAVPSGPIGSSI